MSNKIDWSQAPADATHANGDGVFFRESKRGFLAAFDNGGWVITRFTIADFNGLSVLRVVAGKTQS